MTEAGADFDKVWVIHGPACPYVITVKAFPGGLLSMKIFDAATKEQILPPGTPIPGVPSSKSLGFTPEQCDQLEAALAEARKARP